MCFTSAVFDQFGPHIPYPYTPQPVPYNPPPVVPYPPEWPPPQQLRELLDAFNKALEAARTFDRLTNQPDCEDPDKARLLERVEELERRLGEMGA